MQASEAWFGCVNHPSSAHRGFFSSRWCFAPKAEGRVVMTDPGGWSRPGRSPGLLVLGTGFDLPFSSSLRNTRGLAVLVVRQMRARRAGNRRIGSPSLVTSTTSTVPFPLSFVP
ncbi:uncharacterized protein BO87DRAFT_374456 [Aspergillus neoniger CBS 115656]|uniref:Uncharacterized protein n=2 Tax=Aspergillus subgen. Circumdati TaxID=2720871 RepID=A0A318YV85_ASPNB|nr:hypothetical protein BO87DRAFT_374456 [Aspergillus neoniger CBS 115656]XP_025542512.1 hypothetical protein BO79DRAFT_207949 [Aspergillus costaricaensis CBS 115574]PYH36763.1 hypothetical protein BO87DRAFT_374456 [Aspergillus neoniger CBS 115656]RAK91677.1 hypothetical protein BO79DRAFT_207949 [Aspergillus costaricaensis CBS 115574]